jgi:hypothetical protein
MENPMPHRSMPPDLERAARRYAAFADGTAAALHRLAVDPEELAPTRLRALELLGRVAGHNADSTVGDEVAAVHEAAAWLRERVS